MKKVRTIKRALVSVFHKEGLEEIIKTLDKLGVEILSTGGTLNYINDLGVKARSVEDVTSFPSILGGRVKTLHPLVFGGILNRRENPDDFKHIEEYNIPAIDLVIVDLYPFEKTVDSGAPEQDIIEKIDIGGISLIRAAAKNYADCVIVAGQEYYPELLDMLKEQKGESKIGQRKDFARKAFAVSSHYDSVIFSYFDGDFPDMAFRSSKQPFKKLRYGENPHQMGRFFGELEKCFVQLHGKAISYNNLIDIDAALKLIDDFKETTFAILKHNNACGLASRKTLCDAWKDALAGDPLSAFGGVLVCNREVDVDTAEEINKLFFEVIIAPDYQKNALEILKQKKNRIILHRQNAELPRFQFRTVINGVLVQENDSKNESEDDFKIVTSKQAETTLIEDMIFANKIVKHTKSNAIVLAKNKQLIGSGVGQTSRVNALKQSIEKAGEHGFDTTGAVMASDAFFPFADSVEAAYKAGIETVIQPGGSVRDQDSIDFCNDKGMCMVFTGTRHFKH